MTDCIYVVGQPYVKYDLETEEGVLAAAHMHLVTALRLVEALEGGARHFYLESEDDRGHIAAQVLGTLSGRVRSIRCYVIRASRLRAHINPLRDLRPAFRVISYPARQQRVYRLMQSRCRSYQILHPARMKTLQIPPLVVD